jgi:hypothetical protein
MQAKVYSVDEAFCSTTRSVPMLLRAWAKGTVTTGGWCDGQLAPRFYIRPPDDGIWDLDFVATAPSGPVSDALTSIDSAMLTLELPKWCKGVRVHASINVMTSELFPSKVESPNCYSFVPIPWNAKKTDDAVQGGGDAFPWVFDPSASMTISTARTDDILSETIGSLIGPRVRVYREGEPITEDYRPDRVNIVLARSRSQIVSIYRG